MLAVKKSLYNNHRVMVSLSEVISKFMKLSASSVIRGISQERVALTCAYVADLAPAYNFLAKNGVSLFTLNMEQTDFDFSRYARETKFIHQDKRMMVVFGDKVGIIDNGRLSQYRQIPGLRDFVVFYSRK